MKLYCLSCSEATDYTLEKPKFCSSCGSKFDSVAAQVVQNTPKIERKPPLVPSQPENQSKSRAAQKIELLTRNRPIRAREEEVEEDDEEDVEIPNLANLGKPIVEIVKRKPEKFGDILGTGGGDVERQNLPKGKKKSNKEIWEEFKREAGTRGRNEGQEIK